METDALDLELNSYFSEPAKVWCLMSIALTKLDSDCSEQENGQLSAEKYY